MKTKTISIATSCLALLGLTVNLAWAEDYYSNVPASPPVATSSSGYNSTGSTSQQEYYSSPVYKKEHHSHHHHKHDKFSISVNLPGQEIAYPPPSPAYKVSEPQSPYQWVEMMHGNPLPPDAVIGGYQEYTNTPLFVCRGYYQGGMHPGKLFNGMCYFGWGGREVVTPQYQVLVSSYPLSWIPSRGRLPLNAIVGGEQHDGPLYICQAAYRGGVHPGKVYKRMCHISWGGKEIPVTSFNVLVG